MKNINQLKKEIEKLREKMMIEGFGDNKEILIKGVDLEAELRTLQEVCKETKKVILNIGAEQSDEHLQGMEIFEIELLKKFQGEEEETKRKPAKRWRI